jgi:hypothetical protein
VTDWTDKEARKLRTKINGWLAARMREPQCVSGPSDFAYADALGITHKEATARIKAHEAHLEAFHRSENQPPARPVIDARGPTDWNRKGPDGKTGKALRGRVLGAVNSALLRGNVASYARPQANQARAYGAAMGWTPDQTAGAINRHRDRLAACACQDVRK